MAIIFMTEVGNSDSKTVYLSAFKIRPLESKFDCIVIFSGRLDGHPIQMIPRMLGGRLLSARLTRTALKAFHRSFSIGKLQTGIVGLPNVGKSTLFNALVGSEAAQAANFPFCTIGKQ